MLLDDGEEAGKKAFDVSQLRGQNVVNRLRIDMIVKLDDPV